MNVQKFYEALALIISEREGVKIKVTVTRKDEAAKKAEREKQKELQTA